LTTGEFKNFVGRLVTANTVFILFLQ